MADALYLDANPIVYWALGRSGSDNGNEQKCAAEFEELLSGSDSLACSPPTMAEFMSVVWSIVRSGKESVKFFGEAQAGEAIERLMALMASGRLRVENLHPRAFEVGISLVAAGTKEKKGGFRAWDAIHLFEASQWARTIGREVVIVTADSDVQNIINAFPEFGRYVSVRNLLAT